MTSGFRFLLMAAALLAVGAGQAQEVYRWVDENGVVNFSDTAPPAAVGGGVDTVEVEDTRPSGYDPEQDIYDIAGQAGRMQALRDSLAEQRRQRRERESATAAQRVAPAGAQDPSMLPPWWSRPAYGPGYRPPRPEPPIEPPPEIEPYPTATLRPPPYRGD